MVADIATTLWTERFRKWPGYAAGEFLVPKTRKLAVFPTMCKVASFLVGGRESGG